MQLDVLPTRSAGAAENMATDFLLLQRYILRALLKPEFEGTYGPHWLRKAMLGEAGYLIGAALAWINIPLAFVLYMITPLFFVVPPADYVKRAA